jgi:putative membrane protein insertion efficiency factor
MTARVLVLLISAYQRFLSPLLGPVCRFAPSCSQYMLVCIERFGARRGLWLGVRRLARCHPFHPGGIDLPPEAPAPHPDSSSSACMPSSSHSTRTRSVKQSP